MSLFLLIFSALLGRLFYFQVVVGEKITQQAIAMRSMQLELLEYNRGDILDRNLSSLTGEQTSLALYYLPGVIKREGNYVELASFLSQVLKDKDEQEILTEIMHRDNKAQYVKFEADIGQVEALQINSSHLSGIVVAPVINRYRQDGFCAHLLGYASRGEGGEGQSGMEKAYEKLLHGNGANRELVSILDARGNAIEGLMFKVRDEQRQDSCVVLTIDKRIQEVVEKAMDKRITKGAVVVMDIHSKEILAMASRPTFNPYQVSDIIAFDDRSTLSNRALSKYYPGSLFKILLSTAALEEGKVNMEELFFCSGHYIYNEKVTTSCWKEEGHGELSFAEAFANSCNPTFIQVGLRLGRTKLMQYVDQMHLTDESIIGYNPGKIGTYVKIDGGDPALGNASLGQEGVMLSPVQIASLLSTIADDGWWASPSLVLYTKDQKGQKEMIPKGERQQVITPETAGKVKQILEKVVEEGTGKPAAIPEARVAGKTATSQTGRMKSADEEVLNTWFAGYFPADQPRWAIVVMAEEGSSGAQNCAPVFNDISRGILKYF
jgi:peptidoglycan glycosyltransferase/penicillin-binding protein 2